MSVYKTKIETNDPLTRKRWAKDLYKVMLPEVEFNSLIGTSDTAIIQMKNDLAKGEGDEITFGIRLPLIGDGIAGDESVEGNEEALRLRDFKIGIAEVNKAVDTGGKMEEQRIPYNLMSEAKSALQDWWSQFLSDFVINYLVGNTAYRVGGKIHYAAPEDPDTKHWMFPNSVTSEAGIVDSDIITLAMLSAMKQRAQLMNMLGGFKLRPLNVNGKPYYRVLMHNYVFDQLKNNLDTGEWADLQRNANKLGIPQVEIEWDGLLIQKTERIPCSRVISTNSNGAKLGVYRTVMLGCQAATFGWGGAGDSKSSVMSFVPYDRDAKRFMMIRGGGIFGMAKTRFRGEDGELRDFGVVTASSYGAPMEY